MFLSFSAQLEQAAPVTVIIVSVAIMLLSGFLMTRLAKLVHLPNVTAYLLAGILIGPFCLHLIPAEMIEGTEFLADIALALISFSTGDFFRLSKLKKSMFPVIVITLLESLTASLLVFLLTRYLLRLDFAFSIVLAALASATAPASTMMTIRQTKAKGDFVDALLQVVAYDDIVALLAYSIAISVAISAVSGAPISGQDIWPPIVKNLAVLLIGGLFGVFMKLLIQKKRSTDNRLIIAIALLFGFCGVCAATGVSPLLGCMSMGTVYINITGDDKLFKQLNYFSPPILLLFFVRSGASFDLSSLLHSSGAIGGTPLLLIGAAYFLVRILGKYSGAYLGCLWTHKPRNTRTYFGLALIPQAGVAIGLAAIGARALGGDLGDALETVVLASSVLYELIGPACAKFALYRSGSYSDKLEDLVPVAEIRKYSSEQDEVELLIQRIRTIQQELSREAVSEEEKAFTEAAEETVPPLSELL